MAPKPSTTPQWQSTACILCSLNCGIEVQVDDRHLTRIRGDKAHPVSQGYQCQKASRLDFYQNGQNRLESPLRRRSDGTFEEVSWEVAITEVAARLETIRDTHGGHSLAYYGGGGQGNHMGGAYSSTLRAAMGTRYIYNSLAQEKTGGFWLNGKLFGRQTCHLSEDVHNADYVVFIGTNPWQSHGFPQARKVLLELARDPERTMVVIDPRRTETAEKADLHLQVRPGGDAHLLLALLGTIVQEGLEDSRFLAERTVGWDAVRPHLEAVPVDDYARDAGVDPAAVRSVARGLAGAKAGCVRTDLGLEHSPHSTLNLYLAKLLFLVTGQFAKPGTNNLHTSLVPLIGHSKDPDDGGRTTRVTGMREISKFYPPNVLPLEIDTDHPERVRGLVVDSSNPLMTAADTRALMAGERRSYNANTIIREPDWRKRDREGALRLHGDDARALGLEDGELAVCESSRGAVEARVEITDELRPGVASLPHGYGMEEPNGSGDRQRTGAAINELTASEHCDELAKTPFHKHIPVRIRPAVAA